MSCYHLAEVSGVVASYRPFLLLTLFFKDEENKVFFKKINKLYHITFHVKSSLESIKDKGTGKILYAIGDNI